MPTPTVTESRLVQLEADVAILAGLLVKTCGMTPKLREVLTRQMGGRETRPQTPDESRAA